MYNRLPRWGQDAANHLAMGGMFALYLATLRNPWKQVAAHTRARRGMSWRVDIRDWLGGYPDEYARADAIFAFLRDRGFRLENLRVNNGLLNNEFLFRREERV
jgi:hypothetical protein